MAKSEHHLKIGFILDGGLEKPDGVQQYILALGEYFKSLDHEVRYIVSGEIKHGISDAHSFSHSIHVSSNGNNLSIPLFTKKKKIKEFLKAEKFDVLHVQTPYSPMMGERFIFCCDKTTAVIGTFHIIPSNKILELGNKLLGLECHFSLKRFDQMLSVSSAAQRICLSDFGLESEILPNVIDYAKFHQATASKKNNKLRILFFGRLVERKGCLTLLQAIDYLIKENRQLPEFEVVIGGSGPLKKKLEHFVKTNKLDSFVSFLGFIQEEDKPSLYASSDISIFPASKGESFGIVLLEALSSGKAIVLAGDNEGYKSVLGHKKELMFNANDFEQLAKKLEFYLINNKKRNELADWGAKFARDYDKKIVGRKLLKIYKLNLEKRKLV